MVARIGEDFTLKRLEIVQNRNIFFKSEKLKYMAIEVTSRDDFEIWGVVTRVFHRQVTEQIKSRLAQVDTPQLQMPYGVTLNEAWVWRAGHRDATLRSA